MKSSEFCKACGVRQESDARFCSACGADVAASPVPAEVPRIAGALPQYQKHGSVKAAHYLSHEPHARDDINQLSNRLRVSLIKPGSQAEQLGIKAGDYFVSYNGLSVSSNSELSNAAYAAKSQNLEYVSISLLRRSQELTFKASLEPLGLDCVDTIGERKASSDREFNDHKTGYGLARFILPFASLLGWILLIIGILVTIFGLSKGMKSGIDQLLLLAVLPGLGAVMVGLFTIMIAQIALAVSDSADHSREIMKLLYRKMA